VALAGGEDLSAGAVFGGEEGDDVAEDAVRKVADPVSEALFLFLALVTTPMAAPRPGLGIGK
jgi:hypothetical protein